MEFQPMTKRFKKVAYFPKNQIIIMGLDLTKPVFGVSDKAILKPVFLATETI